MKVRLLGTAAGGGFPQWNCACRNCAGMRSGRLRARRRSQSSVAVSPDGRRWFLLNASPDVRTQIEGFPLLTPPPGGVRGTALEGVLLSNADLDHTLGLFILREGPRLPVYAAQPTRRALEDHLRLGAVLDSYAGLEWREPGEGFWPLRFRSGGPSGLSVAFLPVLGKAPRYAGRPPRMALGESVVMRIRDEGTGGELVYAPALYRLEERTLGWIREADLLLLDGTFFRDDEMSREGIGTERARDMGHLPVGGEGGSLRLLGSLPVRKKVYVHINNTNPMLDEGSPEFDQVTQAGAEVGWDGWEGSL